MAEERENMKWKDENTFKYVFSSFHFVFSLSDVEVDEEKRRNMYLRKEVDEEKRWKHVLQRKTWRATDNKGRDRALWELDNCKKNLDYCNLLFLHRAQIVEYKFDVHQNNSGDETFGIHNLKILIICNRYYLGRMRVYNEYTKKGFNIYDSYLFLLLLLL